MIAQDDTGPRRKRSTPQGWQAQTGHDSLINLKALYQGPVPTQACFQSWRREAARLGREYLHTGKDIYRIAFERHTGGMLMRLKGLQP